MIGTDTQKRAFCSPFQIAHTEPWPGKRMGGHGYRVSHFLVGAWTDDSVGWMPPVWLDGPEGDGLFQGDGGSPHLEPAEVITAELLRLAGVTVTVVDIDELNSELTTGPLRGRDKPQATARIEFTVPGTAESRQTTVRIGYALPLATATDAPVRVAYHMMNQLAVSGQDDLVSQFTRHVRLPPDKEAWSVSRIQRSRSVEHQVKQGIRTAG